MTDLKALAYELLSESQQSLQHNGHLNPAAVVITPGENLIFDLEFQDDDEREEIYAEMMDVAKEKNAAAILTINDVFVDESAAAVKLEGEGWGSLAGNSNEAIVITVSGSGFETWSLISPYVRKDELFAFQPSREMLTPGGEVDLLGDWTGKTGAA
jgi:hypothetical protein